VGHRDCDNIILYTASDVTLPNGTIRGYTYTVYANKLTCTQAFFSERPLNEQFGTNTEQQRTEGSILSVKKGC